MINGIHIYEGGCPDLVAGPYARDPNCPLCKFIMTFEEMYAPENLDTMKIVDIHSLSQLGKKFLVEFINDEDYYANGAIDNTLFIPGMKAFMVNSKPDTNFDIGFNYFFEFEQGEFKKYNDGLLKEWKEKYFVENNEEWQYLYSEADEGNTVLCVSIYERETPHDFKVLEII